MTLENKILLSSEYRRIGYLIPKQRENPRVMRAVFSHFCVFMYRLEFKLLTNPSSRGLIRNEAHNLHELLPSFPVFSCLRSLCMHMNTYIYVCLLLSAMKSAIARWKPQNVTYYTNYIAMTSQWRVLPIRLVESSIPCMRNIWR